MGQQMVRHAARDVGCHGWGGVRAGEGAGGGGSDKWVWEGLLFPQSASRDDEEGEGGCGYVCVSKPPCVCSHV